MDSFLSNLVSAFATYVSFCVGIFSNRSTNLVLILPVSFLFVFGTIGILKSIIKRI